jgi:3-oxoacyl-[acyl-carrier-protein] synthase II
MTPQFNKVAITGLGALSGLGHNLNEVWSGLTSGKSGVSSIEQRETDKLAINIAGEVKNFTLSEDILSAREAARYDRFIHFGLHCAYEAFQDANLFENNPYKPERMGCILGVGMGGFPNIESTYETFSTKGARRVSPFFIPAIIPNMPPGLISINLGLLGPNYTVSSACASAGHALGVAATDIMLGRQDMIITGGTESVLSCLPISGFANMKALSKRLDTPELASRPFDKDRDGFVIGEGAGILVLENLEKAKARGATIYAEVAGIGASSDAHHITAPEPAGLGATRCMEEALKSANISPEEIDYVNAHGTSTPLGDLAETQAIKNVFKDHAYKLNVSSSKSMTGHLLGAAAGVESVFCVKALHEGVIPPTINLNTPGEGCDLNYTANTSVNRDIQYALNNSFGFGGTNSCTVFKKYSS